MIHSILPGRRFAVLAFLGVPSAGTAFAKNDKSGKSPADPTLYSGQATALKIDGVLHPAPGQIVVCDTGPLSPTGGHLQVSEANFTHGNGGVTIDNVMAMTSGSGSQTASTATLSGYRSEFIVTDGGHTHRAVIEADLIYAEATATANKKGTVALATKVIIEGLKVNGESIVVTGQPNQKVELPHDVGGWLVLNEQANAGGSGSGDIAVSAIHFYVCHCIEGHVGLVRAGVTAGDTTPPSDDECGKVTGGGWIASTPTGAKGSFGMSGGIRGGEYWGHLTFNDHGTRLKVQSTAVTGFAADPNSPNGRLITYAVTIDGAPGTAQLRVVDNGEPGRSDLFELTLSTGYRAAGELGGSRPGGGNIQLHKCPPGWE